MPEAQRDVLVVDQGADQARRDAPGRRPRVDLRVVNKRVIESYKNKLAGEDGYVIVFLSLFDDNPAVHRAFCPPRSAYVGEPARLKRESLGVWVILFLSFFTLLAWLMYKEYWKDIH